MADEFCVLPYQERLGGGVSPKFCQVSYGKPLSGKCRDCLIYKQITAELNQLEEINYLVFHALAHEFRISVGLVGEIIADFMEMVDSLIKGIPHISSN